MSNDWDIFIDIDGDTIVIKTFNYKPSREMIEILLDVILDYDPEKQRDN